MPHSMSLQFPGCSLDIRYTYLRPGAVRGPRLIMESKYKITNTDDKFLARIQHIPLLTANLTKQDTGKTFDQTVLVVPCEGTNIETVEEYAVEVTEEEVVAISKDMRMSVVFLVKCDDDGCDAVLRPK